jgi:hypothetical protein
MKKLLSTLLLFGCSYLPVYAQNDDDSTEIMVVETKKTRVITSFGKAPIRKAYWGNSLDGMIFSTALINNNGSNSLGTLRFSMFFHIGATYNYNFSKGVGIYTGLDIKNIGFIEKYDAFDVTVKKRVYTLGVPVGLRFGNMKTRDYFFLGGGLDVAFHYKEKAWSSLFNKTKSNEWFSDRSEILLPYIFAGVSLKGTTIKIQYYPTNFLNEDFQSFDISTNTYYKPFTGKKVNLLLVSVGRDMRFGKKK